MSVKPETDTDGGVIDTIKLALAAALVLGGLVGFYWFAMRPIYERVGVLLAGLVLGMALAFMTAAGRGFWGFVEGSRTEVRKMVWPTSQEAVQTTIVLVIVVLVLGVIMFGVDWLLASGVEWAVGTGN